MEVAMKFFGLKTFCVVGVLALAVSCSSTTGSSNDDYDYEASSSSAFPSSSSIASSSSKAIVPAADSSRIDTSLAAPTGLTATELDGSWILSWNYTDNAKNPAKAFSVQVLDLEVEGEPVWKELAQTIHDVYRYRIGWQASTYLYYRVAALGEDGSRSKYSEEVLVQVDASEIVDDSSSSAAEPLTLRRGFPQRNSTVFGFFPGIMKTTRRIRWIALHLKCSTWKLKVFRRGKFLQRQLRMSIASAWESFRASIYSIGLPLEILRGNFPVIRTR